MVDLDDIFKLATPKYVYIRDAKLGILKYTFMLGIFLYVVVYEIMYSCEHLVPHVATGYGSISMHHPQSEEGCKAKNNCKNAYKNIAKLPYCKESEEFDKDEKTKRLLSDAKDAEVGDTITPPENCRYLDSDRLLLSQTPNEVFVPMRYVSLEQTMNDECYDPEMEREEPHSIADYNCRRSWQTKKKKSFYVADIGDFLLSFSHSYMVPSIGMSGVSTDSRGLFAACPTNHPKSIKATCKRMIIPNTEGDVAAEDEKGTIDPKELGIDSLTGGAEGLDWISFDDLLELTPIAQDDRMQGDAHIADRKLPDKFGHPGESIRQSGGLLKLAVSYDNTGYMRPGFPGLDMPQYGLGAIKPITYTYRPYFIPTNDHKKVEVLFSSDKSQHRTVNIWYGITVELSFEGQLCKFSASVLLTTLTTALVLVLSATTIVTYMALYVFKASDKYTLLMYQYSEDFTDYKTLVNGGKARNIDYAVGEVLVDKAGTKQLSDKEIFNILTNHELRMNKLDGRDPKLSFPATLDPNSPGDVTADVVKLWKENQAFENEFYKRHKGAE